MSGGHLLLNKTAVLSFSQRTLFMDAFSAVLLTKRHQGGEFGLFPLKIVFTLKLSGVIVMTLYGIVKENKSKKVWLLWKKLLPCVFSIVSFGSLSINHIPFYVYTSAQYNLLYGAGILTGWCRHKLRTAVLH